MCWKVSRILNWPVVAIPKNEVVGDVFVAMYRQSCCRCSRLFSGIVHDHTQYGALSMHALENCVKHPLLMVELSTYHDGLTIGACFESGIHRDKKRKNKRQNAYRTTTRIYRACTEHMHTSLHHHRDYVCRSKPS